MIVKLQEHMAMYSGGTLYICRSETNERFACHNIINRKEMFFCAFIELKDLIDFKQYEIDSKGLFLRSNRFYLGETAFFTPPPLKLKEISIKKEDISMKSGFFCSDSLIFLT